MLISYLALLGRIIFLGWERILVKKLGEKSDSISGTFLFFGLGTIFLVPTLLFVDIALNVSILTFVALSSIVYSIAF